MATLPNMFSMLSVSAVLQSRVSPTGTFSTELQFWGTEVRTHAVAGKVGSSRSDVDMVVCLRLARVGGSKACYTMLAKMITHLTAAVFSIN